jgi:hypothetical protein
MGPLGVAGVGPVRHGVAGMIEAEEQGPVQQLITDPAVECLAIAVLHRSSRIDALTAETCCPFRRCGPSVPCRQWHEVAASAPARQTGPGRI